MDRCQHRPEQVTAETFLGMFVAFFVKLNTSTLENVTSCSGRVSHLPMFLTGEGCNLQAASHFCIHALLPKETILGNSNNTFKSLKRISCLLKAVHVRASAVWWKDGQKKQAQPAEGANVAHFALVFTLVSREGIAVALSPFCFTGKQIYIFISLVSNEAHMHVHVLCRRGTCDTIVVCVFFAHALHAASNVLRCGFCNSQSMVTSCCREL